MAVNRKNTGNPEFASMSRANIFKLLILLFALIYIGRLGYLQIVRGSYFLTASEAQAIKQEIIEPFRGVIYDRKGEILVHNEPSFTVKVTPSDFKSETLPLLASLIGMDTADIKKTIKRYAEFSRFEPVRIIRDIDREKALLVEEYNDFLPGVDVSIESKRLYNYQGSMSHLFGYTREISREQLKKMQYYKPGDPIGVTGLEATYEDFLKGIKGIRYVAVNRGGQKVSSFNNGKSDEPVNNGFDLYLSLDKQTQEKATELMEGRRGAVIAIDPTNGEILAYVTKPDFDLQEMSGRVSPEYYSSLRNDPGKPLLNRGVMSAYPPGSTWKMLVAIAGLNEGIINENSTFSCNGSFTFGNRTYGCHGAHGNVNVRNALKGSCNVFFYHLGLKLGLDRLAKYAEMFRFGQKTHVDIPNENRGFYPTAELLEKRFGKGASKYKGRLVNYGIGQGEINVTPIQMAVYLATLANSGTIYQPHVVKEIYNNLTHKKQKVDYDANELPINKNVFEIVKEGMFDVVNVPGGTGYWAFFPYKEFLKGYQLYGKTGTAQNPHGEDHSWFVCYASQNGVPKIAVVAMVENAGFGATVAAPIAYQVIAKYLNPKFDNVPVYDPKSSSSSDSSQTGD